MWIIISKEAAVAAVPLIAAAGVGGLCERIYWGFSYRQVSMKAPKPAAGCPCGVTCLQLSMLTDIAKPVLRLFGSCALCGFTVVSG